MRFEEWVQTDQARQLVGEVAVLIDQVEQANFTACSITVSAERVGALECDAFMFLWGYPFRVRADVPVDRIEIGVTPRTAEASTG